MKKWSWTQIALATLVLALISLYGAVQIEAVQTTIPSAAFRPYEMHASGTPTISSQAGILHAFCINKASGAGSTLSLYDGLNTSGTLLATLDLTAVPGCLNYDVQYQVGLTANATFNTAGSVTFSYRP